MIFLPEEAIIATPFQGVCLTNLRVRSESNQSLTSLMLDQVSCVRATWHTNPGLLFIALVAAIFGIGIKLVNVASATVSETDMTSTIYLIIGLVVATVFSIMYFTSQYALITISSSGGTLRIQTSAKFDKCTEFLEKLEVAKHARTNVLFSL